MIKEYRKTSTVKAERFDGTNEMVKKYNMHLDRGVVPDESGDFPWRVYQIETLKGWLFVQVGDWIATGVNGEHWAIKDNIFKKTYEEVGDIKKAVKAVQFDSWDEDMMSENGIDHPDYGIYLTYINGLQVYLNQGDWIVTYEDGSQTVIPDEDWSKKNEKI